MKYIMLDIQTVPLEIKHEDIKEYLMNKQITKEMRCFDPHYSKIIVITLKPINQEPIIFYNIEEKTILEEFWNYLKQNFTNSILITHNGYKFDIPFLIIRSCINNIEIPININTNKWQMEKSNHFDVMLFLSQYENFINQNLYILGKMHNIPIQKETLTGAEIEKLYKENQIEKIKEKSKQDTSILEEVFKKLCLNYLNKRLL